MRTFGDLDHGAAHLALVLVQVGVQPLPDLRQVEVRHAVEVAGGQVRVYEARV